jgi:pimeloyl-ACP methyl ester carboxylesterase
MNFERTIDILQRDWGLGEAKDVILAGGSAGGLSTYLHLDRLAERLPSATVVGAPVAGYFLDHQPMPGGAFFPHQPTPYPDSIKYMYQMYNSSGALSAPCQTHFGATEAWRCIMAPYAQAFIRTPFFAIQSRFDEWQLGPGE